MTITSHFKNSPLNNNLATLPNKSDLKSNIFAKDNTLRI